MYTVASHDIMVFRPDTDAVLNSFVDGAGELFAGESRELQDGNAVQRVCLAECRA
jgi:hypothetical protein